jgi:hypothetical protein
MIHENPWKKKRIVGNWQKVWYDRDTISKREANL